MGSGEDRVRVQILVDKAVGDVLEDLAKDSEMSVARAAGLILEFTVNDRTKLIDWVSMVLSQPATVVLRSKIEKTGETFYLQASVERDIAEKLPDIAERLNQTPSKMAALLLEWRLRDYEWILRRFVEIANAPSVRNGTAPS